MFRRSFAAIAPGPLGRKLFRPRAQPALGRPSPRTLAPPAARPRPREEEHGPSAAVGARMSATLWSASDGLGFQAHPPPDADCAQGWLEGHEDAYWYRVFRLADPPASAPHGGALALRIPTVPGAAPTNS